MSGYAAYLPAEELGLSGVTAAVAIGQRIDDLEREEWTLGDSIDRLRGIYRYRRKRFAARFDDDIDHEPIEQRRSCATRARSPMRSCATSSATST